MPVARHHGLRVTAVLRAILVEFPSLIRPPPEQAAIVRYLDHVDRRVRRLVRAKRKLIALLTEQKQAIIHRAVTRGLDPDVPLKDSGVEWLGEVPAHWDVVQLGRIGTIFRRVRLQQRGTRCLRAFLVSVTAICTSRHSFFVEETKACVRG